MPYGTSPSAFVPLFAPGFAPPPRAGFDVGEDDEFADGLMPPAPLAPPLPAQQPFGADDGMNQDFVPEMPHFEPTRRFDMSRYAGLEDRLQRQIEQSGQPPSQYLTTGQTANFEKFFDDNSDLVERYQQVDKEMKAENSGQDWIKYFAKRSIPGFSTGYQIADLEAARRAADKLETEPLTNEDAYALAKLLNEMEESQKRKGLAKAGDILAELPAFAGELFATAGTGAIARNAVTKALTKLVSRRLVKKTAGRWVARQAIGATAKTAQVASQTALQPLQVTKNTLNRNVRQTLAGERESIGASALHGVGQTALETATEMLVGKAIQNLVGKGKGYVAAKLAEKTPTLDKLRQRLVEKWVGNKAGRTLADGWKKVADQAGWNGMLGEMGEERVNEIVLGVAGELGVTGSEYEFGVTGKVTSGNFGEAYDDLWPEMVAFALPGATMTAAGGIANYYGLGKSKQQKINDYMAQPASERLYRQAVAAGMPAMPSPLAQNRENRINHAKAMQQAAVEAASVARQAAGVPDIQTASRQDIADAAAPSPPQNDVPTQDDGDATSDAGGELSEQDRLEVQEWVDSLGIEEILDTPERQGFLSQLEARPNPDAGTLLTIQLMREAVAANEAEPGVTSEVPTTPTTLKGGDPNAKVQEGQGGQVRQIADSPVPEPTNAGAGMGPAPVVPPVPDQPAVATGGTVAAGGEVAPGGSEAEATPPLSGNPPAQSSNPAAQSQRTDSDDVRDEWQANAAKVADNPEKATSRELHRARGYLDHQRAASARRLERGEITESQHRDMIDSLNREDEWYSRILKSRGDYAGGGPYSDEKPAKPPKKKRSLDDIDSISDDDLDAAIAGKKPAASPSQLGVAAKPQTEEVGKPASNAPAGATLTDEPRSTVSARNQREQWIRQSPEAAKPAAKERSLSDHFAEQFSAGKSYPTIVEARKEAGEILGKKILKGTPEAKVVEESVEVGVVKAARKIIEQAGKKDARGTFTKLASLYQRQPKLGTRTSTSMVNQAYSTPAPLAFVASRLVDVSKSDTVYEPTAGNGMLLIEANPDNTHANEIDKSRADALREQGFQVTEADASTAQPADQYDVIQMNPPFGAEMSDSGASKTFVIDGVRTTKRDQAIPLLALKALKKDGRATIIIGSPQYQKKTTNDKRQAYLGKNKAFFERLYDVYHVVDHFSVDGGLYDRQGAGFPVDVIVIDGRKDAAPARPKPWQQEPQWFNTWDELGDAKLLAPVQDKLPPPVPPPAPPPKDDTEDEYETRIAKAKRLARTRARVKVSINYKDAEATVVRANGEMLTISPEGEFEGLEDQEVHVANVVEIKKSPKPPKAPPPPKPPKDKPPAPPKKDDILSDKTKEAQKAFADKAKEMLKKYGNKSFSPTSLDPEMLKDFYDLTKLGLRAGVRTFADYVRFIGKTINMQIARQWSGAMSDAWTNLGEEFDGLDSVGNVNEVLDTVEAEIEAENKQDEKPPEKTDSIDELAETEHQVKYESESKNPFSAGTLIPTNQRDAVMESLAKVREAHGDIDKYVAKELNLPAEVFQSYFSSEQADALGLAIHNFDRNGSALVLADQTGVGKGRVVAGMMRFAHLRGLVPVFATEKSALFSDIIRDLTAIGENTGEPPFEFIATNDTTGDNAVRLENDPLDRVLSKGSGINQRMLEEAIASKTSGGKFEAKPVVGKNKPKVEYKAVFTTYSQLQTDDGSEKWQRSAFRRLMPHAFLILDEAHNAGGADKGPSGLAAKVLRASGLTAPDRAEFVREITMNARGVMYSTATWAKRPGTTTLYNRTDMPLAMNGDVSALPDAIQKGGVPLLQVVSQMLAEAGQLIRREKSFKGVKFEPKTVDVSIEDADKMTAIFREITDRFDPAIEDVIEGVRTDVLGAGGTIAANNATGPQAVTATNFSTMMWNAVDQMLFALKADKAADEAIAAHKAGETPVIAVDSTMESILDEYVKDNGVKHGDAISLNFGDILQRYLERGRWYTIKLGTKNAQGKNNTERVRLSDEELNQDTQTGNALEIFNDIKAKIKALNIDAPASPIDWIRYRLEQAGIKTAEVTGRENVVHYNGKGQMTLGVRSEDEVGNTGKLKTIRDLNSGATGAILLNRSGSTGLSIHASKDFKNQKPRHMIIAQAAKNIDEFMQMLGRIHRTGQVVLPRYTLLMSNMPSENRPAAVLSKKLAKLNAAVTAKSKGAVGFDVPDVMNEVGGFVVQQFLADNPEINDMLGDLPLTVSTGIPPAEWYEELARKATGLVSILPYKNQVEFWDAISQGFKDRIAQLDALGENPLIAKTLPLEAKTLEKFTLFEGNNEGGPFARPADLEKVKAKIVGRPKTTPQVHDEIVKFYGMDSMLDFHREQSKWEGKSVYDITTEADAYREEAAQGLATQAAVDRRLNMIDRQEQLIADAMRQYSPGNVVTVTIPGGELVGVVTSFKRVGKPKNPVQPSSWVIRVAVNDAIQEVDIPVSQISARLAPQSSSMAGVLETFDRAQSISTENRWIATGNLLAAFDRLSDQHVKVTFFTDDQGKTRSGLLLPRSFNASQYLEKRPVVMDTAANALTFLQRGGAALSTPDGVLVVSLAGNQLIFSAPAARSRSGKYTTHPKIRAASLPREFITPQGSQRTTMIIEGEPAMKKVLTAVLGETSLQANIDRELARAILGITASGEKIDSDSLERLDDAEASRAGKMAIMGAPPVTVDAQSTTEADFPVSPGQIIRRLEKLFDVPIRSGGMSGRSTSVGPVLAQYNPNEEVIRRLKQLYGELGPVVHEVAHHFNNEFPEVRKKMTPLARLDLKKLDYDKKQRRAYEGFAEFIRRWMTEDVAQLRKDAPDYFQHFEDFLKFNPEAEENLKYARELVGRWRSQTASQRNQAVIRDTREPDRPADETAGERLRDTLKRKRMELLIDWFDPGAFLKRIDEATEDAGYKRGREESKLYDLFDAMNMTASNHAYRALEKGVHSVGEGTEQVYSQGLLNAFEAAKLTEAEKAEWTEWAISKRLLALRDKHGSDYAMPFQIEDIEKVMDDFAGYDPAKQKRFEKLGRAVHQFNDDLITMMRDAGLIGELEHDRIINDLDFYLPLERIADRAHVDGSLDKLGLGGMLNVTSPLKRLSPKGSQLPVMHPILSTVYRAIRFYDAAIRQQITLQMARQLDPQLGGAKGMGWLMSRVPPSRQPQRLDATKVWEEIKPDLKAQGLDVDAVDPTLLPESITLWKALHRPSYKDMTIRVMVPTPTLDEDSGAVTYEMKPVLYELDSMLHYSLDQMNPVELGSFLTVTKKLGDVLKMGAIGLNPEFALRNAINDWMGYQATATTGAKSVTAPVANLAGYGVRKVTNTGTEFDDLYDEFVGNEGAKFGIGVRSPEDIAKKLLNAGDTQSTLARAAMHPLQAISDAKRGLEDLIAMSEVGPRYSEFLSVLNQGFDLKQDSSGKWRSFNTATQNFERPPRHVLMLAKKAASDIMPFHRRGKSMKKVDALIPLFGAAITGMTKFAQTHRDAINGKPGARSRLATFYLLQVAAELALWAMFGDDDRDDERPAWMLSRHNALGLTVPRGREWGIPGMLTRGMLNDYSGHGSGLSEAALESAKQFVPPHTSPVSLPFELANDRDWWKWKRVEGQNLQDNRLPVNRVKPNTRPIARWLGENVGLLSPVQWDFAMDRMTGGVPGRLQDEAKDIKEGKLATSIPFVSGIVEKREYTRSVDDIYDAFGEAKQIKGSATATKTLTQEQYNKTHRLHTGTDLVSEIRELATGKDAKTKEQYDRYATGAARFFLGDKDINQRYPNPLAASGLPADVQAVVDKVKFSVVKSATNTLKAEDHTGEIKSGETDDTVLASRALLREIAPTQQQAFQLLRQMWKSESHGNSEASQKALELREKMVRRTYSGTAQK